MMFANTMVWFLFSFQFFALYKVAKVLINKEFYKIKMIFALNLKGALLYPTELQQVHLWLI